MNLNLNSVAGWFKVNKLYLNVGKTNYVLLSRNKSYVVAGEMKLSIGQNLLDRVHCAKYLGIFIDKRLDWHEQIQLCKSKITSGIYIMNDVKHLKTIYHTLIRPYLYHGNLLWGSAYKRYTKLLVLQKKLSNYFHQSLNKLDYILQSFLYHDSKLLLELPQYVKEAKSVSSSNYHYESCLNFACHLDTLHIVCTTLFI